MYKIWAPSEYPAGELEAIVTEFFDGEVDLDNIREGEAVPQVFTELDIDDRFFSLSRFVDHKYAMARMSLKELLGAIDEKGYKGFFVDYVKGKSREEQNKFWEDVRRIKAEILARPEVQERMTDIRAVVGAAARDIKEELGVDVKISFGLLKWWSHGEAKGRYKNYQCAPV